MTYEFLQQYWWFLVSLLGALLVFLMFVQGANALIFVLGKSEEERRLLVNATGSKWELTFTTLVTFGGAFFASFPLFYSTSFGGAYWLWMVILFSFVLQAVSYEFQGKLGNLLGTKTFQSFLVANGVFGPLLLGGAVATFFEGSNFVVEKENFLAGTAGAISHWANDSHGLDALLNPWVLVLGITVATLAMILGCLYIISHVENDVLITRARSAAKVISAVFAVCLLLFVSHLLTMDGYAVNADNGEIFMQSNKYLHNLLSLLVLILAVGALLFVWAVAKTVINKAFSKGFWPASVGVVLIVLALFLTAGYYDTAYYPSAIDLQSSLTLANSCSSEFTLRTMFYVSLLIPFVLAYIAYAWYSIEK